MREGGEGARLVFGRGLFQLGGGWVGLEGGIRCLRWVSFLVRFGYFADLVVRHWCDTGMKRCFNTWCSSVGSLYTTGSRE